MLISQGVFQTRLQNNIGWDHHGDMRVYACGLGFDSSICFPGPVCGDQDQNYSKQVKACSLKTTCD
jgi:hypothetical protein